MDALYFNTKNKDALFEELELPEGYNGGVYESPGKWVIVWLGKLPATTETRLDEDGMEYEEVAEWQDGEFFNIYLIGQPNMDFFTQQLRNAKLLKEPATPNHQLL